MSPSVRHTVRFLTSLGIRARTHERPALPVERVCVANEIGCLHAKKIVPENVSESTLLEARSGSAVRVGNGVGSAVHKSERRFHQSDISSGRPRGTNAHESATGGAPTGELSAQRLQVSSSAGAAPMRALKCARETPHEQPQRASDGGAFTQRSAHQRLRAGTE